jgi:hypothetical protein
MDLHWWCSRRPAFTGNSTSQRRRCSTSQRQWRLLGRQGEGIRVGHSPSPSFICGLAVVGWTGPRPGSPTGHSQAAPAHRPTITRRPPVSSSSRSPSYPLNFQKVHKNFLNFNLALRLLSFIYSDLLVLYIYVLDLELFYNFYVVMNNIICTIRYMYLCNLNVIITAVIIHVYDPQIISRC